MLSENGDAAFGVQRISDLRSGDGGTRSGRGAAHAFNNIIIISPIFLLHQGEAAVSAALATFNADTHSRFPRFFFVEKEGRGADAQVALWGYVHASGTMQPSLLLPVMLLRMYHTLAGEQLSVGGCLRDDMIIDIQGVARAASCCYAIKDDSCTAGVASVFACASSGEFSGAIDASSVISGEWQKLGQQQLSVPSATHFATWCP